MSETPQSALTRLAQKQGVSLSALSRMLGRNVAYLQQFVSRGSPRVLPERDRTVLAAFLGVDAALLGAPEASVPDDALVPYLAVAASAGAGAAVTQERVVRHERFPLATLRAAGITPGAASVIDVAGDSMMPTLENGDRLLVDRADRRVPAAGALFVIRFDGALSVKRLVPAGAQIEVRSDNPAWPTLRRAGEEVEVIGRARLLMRGL
jgi:phage repressor protein C with HTH and peptisase S24 domain